MSVARDTIVDALDSLSVARGALEAVKPRNGTRIAGCVKEALEELDYVDEALVTIAKSSTPKFGRGSGAIWDWIGDMEQSGEWDTRQRIEEYATRAATTWEQQRNGLPGYSDMVQIEVPLQLPGAPVSVHSNAASPLINQQFQTYRILIPTACRSKYQAKYVAQRQLEEAFGL